MLSVNRGRRKCLNSQINNAVTRRVYKIPQHATWTFVQGHGRVIIHSESIYLSCL